MISILYQWIIAVATLLIPAWAGVELIGFLKIFQERTLKWTTGSIFGITLFGTVLYYVAHFTPLQPVVVWAILIIFLFLAFGMRLLQIQKKKKLHTDNIASILFIFSLILFAIIGSKLLIQQKDGLYTGIINAYGDVGWHTALITELAQAKTLPLQDPIFAGTSLTYPFLSNAISSAMLIIGSCIAPSMDAPAIILLPIIIVLLYHFGRIYGGSKKAGIIVLLLFLFGGATFGWTRIFGDIQQSNESLTQFITHLPHRDYSGVGGDADGFDFLNPVTSLLLPQRAMLFGLPIVLSVLILLSPVIIKKKYSAISAGILAGMLPLFHAHACIALAVTIIALFLASKQKKKYVQFLIPALIFGIPELFFYTHGDAQSGSFFRLAPGWMKGDINFFVFWIQNTGIILPASILVLFIKRIPIQARALSLAGLSLFALANIFLFAPWAWDNFKILVFWYLLVLPGIASACVILWNSHTKYIVRPLIVLILFIQIFSGVLDIWKLALPTATTWQEWGTDATQFAQTIQNFVPINTPITTASVHNSPVVLAGRLMYLGYPAHVWSHGVSPWMREADIKSFFNGTSQTISGEIPRYILVGPQELSSFPNLIIQPQWQLLAEQGEFKLFKNP